MLGAPSGILDVSGGRERSLGRGRLSTGVMHLEAGFAGNKVYE
jgi:hypothetical protein